MPSPRRGLADLRRRSPADARARSVSSRPPAAPVRAPAGWKRSCSSARSIARSRSGRSGWPGGVTWSRQAGWVMRSVVIGCRQQGSGRMSTPHSGHGFSRQACEDFTPGGGGSSLGHEEILRQRHRPDRRGTGRNRVTPSPCRKVSSIRKLPVKRAGLLKIAVGRVGQDFGLARHPHHGVAAEQVLDRGGGDGGARPQRVDRDALARATRRPGPAPPGSCRTWPWNRRCAARTISPSCRAAATASGCAGSPPSRR